MTLTSKDVFEGGPTRYLINYGIYARPELDAEIIHHVCNKDDVEAILEKIEAQSGLSMKSTAGKKIDLLLDYYDSSIKLNTWEKMIQNLI